MEGKMNSSHPDVGKMEADRDIDGLIGALGPRSEEVGLVPEDAAYALGRIGDKRAAGPLVQCLGKEPLGLAIAASIALAEIFDVDKMEAKGDVDGLIEALGLSPEEVTLVAENAAYALGRIGDERAVDSLIQCLRHKDSFGLADLAPAAAYALGGIGKPAVERLIQVLKDEDSELRNFAEIALEQIDEPEAENALAEYRAR